jgi:protein-L-isoaspartate(D-aspartate) O-methyltransferase
MLSMLQNESADAAVKATRPRRRLEVNMGPLKITLACIGVIWIVVVGTGKPLLADPDSGDRRYTAERRRMVRAQIQARGVSDPGVLAAMGKVARHRFVPKPFRHRAYADHPLPIGEGQTISQPYIVALMTESLQLDGSEKVLEIGTGSGYQAAVLAELARDVYTIEIFESLGRRAAKTLAGLGYANVHVRVGDGYQGWPEYSPFDAVIVTCAPTHIPRPLKAQLAEGGRMIIPVGEQYAQKLVLLTKTNGEILQTDIIDVRFVPMIDEAGKTY